MSNLTRRSFLKTGAAAVAGLTAAGMHPRIASALASTAPAGAGQLNDIEHIVIFIQENRSFDHYFGTLDGVRGYGDPAVLLDDTGTPIFAQQGWTQPGYGGRLLPFHTDTSQGGECTKDISHDWGPQHRSFNGGKMDRFLLEHLAADGSSANAALTMSYFQRADLAFYYALADAFTVCDGYHCSVQGPTETNRFMSMSASMDPDGTGGGPVLNNLSNYNTYTWTSMPERLQAAGISWKFYSQPTGTTSNNVLYGFKAYYSDPVLAANGLAPTFPGTFESDVAAGMLPQVSWVTCANGFDEHPTSPPTLGAYQASQMLSTLMSNATLWSKTVVFITYDENGGFFDHVPPPVAPPGTPGEYVTVSPLPSAAEGIAGPVGLGFRVPMTIVSPFARGGFVCSDTFDHTSLLRFIETRFGVEVPNLSAWRRGVTGDLTSALNFAAPDVSIPTLPTPSPGDPAVISCVQNNPASPPDYPVPANTMPQQEAGTRPRPSGPVPAADTPEVPFTGLEVLAGVAVGGALILERARRKRTES